MGHLATKSVVLITHIERFCAFASQNFSITDGNLVKQNLKLPQEEKSDQDKIKDSNIQD